MAFLDTLRSLDAKATPGPWAFDEPSNWHGLSARLATKEDMGAIIGQITLPGWGRSRSLKNAEMIVLLRNHAARIAAVVEAAEAHVVAWGATGVERAHTLIALRAALAALEAP